MWIGNAINIAEIMCSGTMIIQPKDGAVAKVSFLVNEAVRKTKLSRSDASSLRGIVNWVGTLSAGRCGRIGLEVLKQKQRRGADPWLNEDEISRLKFLKAMYTSLPPRTIEVVGRHGELVVAYTDASLEPESGCMPKLGWVIFGAEKENVGVAAVLSQHTLDTWVDRKTQIFPAEAFAPLLMIEFHGEQLRGKDIIIFVDNEAAAAALIRGSSSSADVGLIVQAFHWKLHQLQARVWIEWIDSESNPADGLSRDGIRDEWTRMQGWKLMEAPERLQFGLCSFREELLLTLG